MKTRFSALDLPLSTDVNAIPSGRYSARMIGSSGSKYVRALANRALPQEATTTSGTFKDRYILGSGFPHVPIGEDSFLVLFKTPFLRPAETVPLDWPDELDLNALPKYRVVLEKIDD